MHWYLEVWRRYAEFSGRSRRKEYWLFTLYNTLIYLAVLCTGAVLDSPQVEMFLFLLYLVFALAAMIPSLAVAIRRLHDTNHSGWWIFISVIPLVGSIILLVFLARDSEPGKNQYGPNPKGVGEPWDDRDELHDYQGQTPKAVTQPWDDEIL